MRVKKKLQNQHPEIENKLTNALKKKKTQASKCYHQDNNFKDYPSVLLELKFLLTLKIIKTFYKQE